MDTANRAAMGTLLSLEVRLANDTAIFFVLFANERTKIRAAHFYRIEPDGGKFRLARCAPERVRGIGALMSPFGADVPRDRLSLHVQNMSPGTLQLWLAAGTLAPGQFRVNACVDLPSERVGKTPDNRQSRCGAANWRSMPIRL
jgi:hypothetical protein